MTQPAQEPIETTRDLASMSDIEYGKFQEPSFVKSYEEKFEIIKKEVLRSYGVAWEYVNQYKRGEPAEIRQVIFYLAKEFLPAYPLKRIGAEFKGRTRFGVIDHSTVVHGIGKISDLCDVDKKLKRQVESIRLAIKEKIEGTSMPTSLSV